MSGTLGYDPMAVEQLRRETIWALKALLGLGESDAAAAPADRALTTMRNVLEAHWLPAIAAIQHHDPLSGGMITRSFPILHLSEQYNDHRGDLVDHTTHRSTEYQRLSIVELFGQLELMRNSLPHDDDLRPDLGNPFWIEFEALARELADRVAAQPELADALVARVRSNPLLAIAVGFARFPPPAVQAMAIELLSAASHVDDVESRYDALAAETLLRTLLPHPALVLGVVIDLPALRELIQWPSIDPDLAAEFVRTGMLHPVDDPSRVDDGLTVLEHFVTLANQRLFERGFPQPFPEVIASGVAVYLPEYIASLEAGDNVHLATPEGVTAEEFHDLLGALLYDPIAADVLLGAVRSMAILSLLPNSPFDISDVGDFGMALTYGAENERLEAELRAATSRALVQHLTVAVGFAAGSVAAARGLSSTTRALIGRIVNHGGAAAEGAVRADDTGIGDPSATIEALVELTVCETFLADPDHHRDSSEPIDQHTLHEAHTALAQVGELVATGASPAVVENRLSELQAMIKTMGGEKFLEVLDTGSIHDLDRHDSNPDT